MTRYLVGRIGQLVLVLFGVSVIVFFTMHVLPGDVATLLLGERATLAQLASLRHQLGLDQPIFIQYFYFLLQVLQGDFGMSLRSNHAALADVLVAFPVTLQLALAALALAVVIGVPVGIIAGTRPSGLLDNLLMTATLFGVSMPIFWLGLMLLLLFGGLLGWLPIGGLMPTGLDAPRVTGMTVIDSLISGRPHLIWESLRYLTLPAVTLATIPLAMIARITRSEMLAMGSLDHVRTARAKGMPERRVILRHILRNALIPVVTVIGLQLGLLLSGAVLTETIFSLPGLGRLMVDSILSRDYPVVQAGALFIAFVFVLVNLVVDLTYGLLDPRIRRS
ncbi:MULTISPECIES: ABC transporter permease [unclassified Acidisoma]|jgi:peptide/nickel transport system permease protein|uniref:ABC transporter permease n=1 Tax=unclassified Acidisoma TaxID=2634065 RepID=UPI00131D2D29|nr:MULTISPECIES: ABC transporter permease [unclassified Acidisoma]